MYAIVKTSGQQFKVAPGDLLTIDRMHAEEGSTVSFDEVLLVSRGEGDAEKITLGHPAIDGAKVTAEVVQHLRGEKILIATYKRRKNERRRKGFRADLTQVKVLEVQGCGA